MFSSVQYVHIVYNQSLLLFPSETLSLLKCNSPLPSPPGSWQPLFYFLFQCIWLLQVFYMSGSTRCSSFCDWLISLSIVSIRSSLVAQRVKCLPAMWETHVLSLGWEDPRRRKWQPTPVLLPGKSRGRRNLVGYSPWGCKVLDMTGRLNHNDNSNVFKE